VVSQILVSNEQHIVLGTNQGLGVFTDFRRENVMVNKNEADLKSYVTTIPVVNNLSNVELRSFTPFIEIYNSSTGYPINDVNLGCNSMYKDSQGIIWVGTGSDKTGLVRFDYSAISKNLKPLIVNLHTIKINQQDVCWYNLLSDKRSKKLQVEQEFLVLDKSLTDEDREHEKANFGDIKFDGVSKFYHLPQQLILPYHSNTLTFGFSAVEPARPNLVKYQYMLEGYSDDWSPSGNMRDVTFGNLFEGTYRFQVRAANQYGVWNKPVSFCFTILPPFYRTWWAYLLYGIGLCCIIFCINYLRNRNSKKLARLIIQKQDEEKYRISRDLHDDLGQELSFLKMNSDVKYKPDIDRVLSKIRAISFNLSPVRIVESSIKELLTELINEAEKSNLFFSYEIDDVFISSYEVKINLYRIVQEALNNIVRHSNAENVRITLRKIDDHIILVIQDNGIGISSLESKNSIGLSSMKERAKIIDGSITFDTIPLGTRIRLKLRLPNV